MKNKGFTLVEVLAVISIIGVLMVVFVPSLLSPFYKAKNKISDMERNQIIDAGKLYLVDLDNSVIPYVYEEEEDIEINGKTYHKGDEMTGYDLRTYIITNDGIKVDIKALVKNGYYDKTCNYETNPQKCKVKDKCILKVKINGEKVQDGKYYVSNGYESEIMEGCTN